MKRIWGALRRGKVMLLALMVALALGAASTATGHPGSAGLFHKNHSNTVNAISTFVGSVAGPILRLDNNNAGGTALDLQVEPNRPPMTVNTGAGTATNLSADRVDNFNANELVRGTSQWAFVNTSAPSHSADIYSASAPRQGGLLINLDFACASFSGTTNTRWDIFLRVDGVNDPRSVPGLVRFSHADLTSYPADSTSVTSFVPVGAGTHTIGYLASRSEGDGSLDCNINASSLFVPFNDAGGAPAAEAAGQAPSQQMLEGKGNHR